MASVGGGDGLRRHAAGASARRDTVMERSRRLASAIRYLGPRQTVRNLARRALDRVRSLERYRRPRGGDLELQGRAASGFCPLYGPEGPRLEGNVFLALGERRSLGEPPDWDAPGNALWRFNLHYFGFLEQLDDERAQRLLLDWVERYAPHRDRPGWAPYPLSLRLRSWTRRLIAGPDWPDHARRRILDSIECQGDCLADRAEFHLRGNHLLENGVTLKLLATVFGGMAVSRWRRVADRILEEELDEQLLPDGGHFERSPMYQALLVGSLLDLYNVLPAEDPARASLAVRLPGLLAFVDSMRHPDGEIALFNDAALGFAPPPHEILAYGRRLGLSWDASSRSFPDTGYAVWQEDGEALLMDCGPIGPDYVPAHAHADIFSFEMSYGGHRLVVDGGTSTYTAGAERDWLRGTRAHNTVEVEGMDQCEVFDAFRVGRRGRPHDVRIETSRDGLSVSGWHDAYRRLAGAPLHRRDVRYLRGGTLVVWDEVDSRRQVACTSRLRFAPGVRAERLAEGSFGIDSHGTRFRLATFGGAATLVSDRYAPRFGEIVPNQTVALKATSGARFGYALCREGVDVVVDADGVRVGDRRIVRSGQSP